MDFKTATLHKKIVLTEDTYEFQFKTDPIFTFTASQFVTIKVPTADGKLAMRAYSISCKPTEDYFELCVKLLPDGTGSNYLRDLNEGEKIEFIGPAGHFTFTSPEDKTIIFVATGTGIAPIKAMLENELEKGSVQKMHLIFGLRYIKDVFYKEIFEALAAKYPNFTFDITLSRPEDESWTGKTGRVTDVLRELEIDPANTEGYICGLKEMVGETSSIMKEKGLNSEAIHFERFN